ncbi:cytokine receptor common subunit beta [Toxotes jaculatrix]|uniref:cytokine receptor common subunit beta n=1 Tax=Toxotes jaculatrix TaxID=941984 RepID=UPI001B3AE483|nr:cytokine receptor common subunit beta [Toxotes jaculatrix]XP_040917905.1 cytokine receptor common subunit beta [Toxotes jaculatrix]XP_040917906.1 cytokine receptor common subunit beta [Toxotes jaculatrix]
MMPLLWVVLWSVLPLALLSGPDRCAVHESSNSEKVSPLLESLQCYNDYNSFVRCKWRKHRNTSLQLWFSTTKSRKLCEPDSPQIQDEPGMVQCTYKTKAFSIGIHHTVFFLKNDTQTICSPVQHKPQHLSQYLRARPPVDLSTHDTGDGGRQLSWSSPYPPSSSLNKNLTYQLSYRTDRRDTWTTEDITNTSMKLEKHLLLQGHTYEAKVRAQASVGQWSNWSPMVTWKTEADTRQLPSLHCVLDGEKEVVCSWEVSMELGHFITYQLACRNISTALSERCCVNQTVTPDPSGTVLRYSCLTVADPAHLELELQPAHKAKTFEAYRHIQPHPPKDVKVTEKDYSWMVEWTERSTASVLKLYYQVCYYRTQDPGCSTVLNISEGSKSVTFQGESLAPSQRYQVRVRSLVIPGEGMKFEGIPSEWTDPVEWTSHAATWSLTTLIYVLISVLVATVFFTFYCSIPACQRKVVLWVDSVPSPGKSKIMSEIKSATSWTLMQTEDTSICKVLHFDTMSTCSSNASLWPTMDTNKKCLELGEGSWSTDELSSPAEKVNSYDTSSFSFSGPYIFCQTPEPNCKPVVVKYEEKEKEEKPVPDDPASPVNFALYGDGYVCLPNRTTSRSTQDLVSHSDANTNTQGYDSTEQDQQCPDTKLGPENTYVQPGHSETILRDQPPAYTSERFMPWPHGGTIQPSGYCHLPQP